MAQAIWTGSLSFGLVTIPVKLFNATSPRDVRFHQFDSGTGRRVRYRRVVRDEPSEAAEPAAPPQAPYRPPVQNPSRVWDVSEPRPESERPDVARPSGELEVAYEDIVKGYEVAPDRFVMVDPRELRSLSPERSQVIEIEDFVDLAEIDPAYFEKSYFVAPRPGMAGDKPYWLLLRAMEAAGKVGIARFVMRTKEYLAAVRPSRGAVMLETLFYADEVREPSEVRITPEVKLDERELRMADLLIQSLATGWDPAKYRDTYRERVLELVQSKAAGELIVEDEAVPPRTAGVADLIEALKASVEAARKDRAETDGPGGQPARDTPKRASRAARGS